MLARAPGNEWVFDYDSCGVMGQRRKLGFTSEHPGSFLRWMEYGYAGEQDPKTSKHTIKEEESDRCPHVALQLRWGMNIYKADE